MLVLEFQHKNALVMETSHNIIDKQFEWAQVRTLRYIRLYHAKDMEWYQFTIGAGEFSLSQLSSKRCLTLAAKRNIFQTLHS